VRGGGTALGNCSIWLANAPKTRNVAGNPSNLVASRTAILKAPGSDRGKRNQADIPHIAGRIWAPRLPPVSGHGGGP
jgi:hypothetical protein